MEDSETQCATDQVSALDRFAGDGQPAGRNGGPDRDAGRYSAGYDQLLRQNEEEADRIGIQDLQQSGFDPQAMPMVISA